MNDLDIFKQFIKKDNDQKVRGNNAVVYTRVSTKEQAEGNASLSTQKKYCIEFAKKRNLNIVDFFGGTYESAKSDERKEFKRMLEFVKRKKNISIIIVYSYDRFSRTGANGAYISNTLQKQGITVLSVTQELDPMTPSGSFQQNLYYMFSQFDNELRKDKCVTGMQEKLRQGYWVWKPPFGYTNLNQGKAANEQKIVVNEDGKLLRKAFMWKAKYNWSTHRISEELSKTGYKISEKSLSAFYRNPFYCGIIINSILPDEIIEGNHEQLVSKEIFLKVNNLLSSNAQGYKTNKTNDNLPLKQFLKCDDCGTPFTGYIVAKKGIYYYKCRKKGCKKNRNAEVLHDHFSELLKSFVIDPRFVPVIKKMMYSTFVKYNKDKLENQKLLESNLKKLKTKHDNLEERFAFGEIGKEIYQKYSQKITDEIREIEKDLDDTGLNSSNLEKCIENVVELSCNLNKMWDLSDYDEKRKIQYLVFPEGIWYDRKNDRVRTNRVNSLFFCLSHYKRVLEDKKSGTSTKLSEDSAWVVPPGIEPGTPGFSVLCSTN